MTSREQGFIFGTNLSKKFSSDQLDKSIDVHEKNGVFVLDLASATTTVTSNPFVGGSNSTGNSGGGKSSAASKTWTKADKTLLAHGMVFILVSAFVTALL